MLELVNIKKDYKLKDQEPVHALKGISLKFRRNEFVAILGHSGCGKTTLLNITGGLDKYDSGDLIIEGKSTKNYTDRDWDTYRNHSIGFVFQSYNLIPHQSIIKNVELSLTIAGLSKEERTKRAEKALDKVGLKGLYKKKPNQLSGGQMQRVAIARALVNNPEIVLADEPTGALDSETSVQIMDLLQEVAKDHLVIMVTHNPDLATQYATRIVRMKDGELVEDSAPYDGKDEVKLTPVEKENKGNKKRSSMSFFTAANLSFSNLLSKLHRTILVVVAGSIGIIGVSTILGVSCGVNDFIGGMENDLLSSYPIQIAEETVDTTALLNGLSNQDGKDLQQFDVTTHVGLDSMISYLMEKFTDFTNVKTNDITQTLKDYVEAMPKDYYSSMSYNYSLDPTNNIFTRFKKTKDDEGQITSINGLTQSYIKTLMTVDGFKNYASFVDIFTNFMKEIPGSQDYILSQFDLLAGEYPTEEDEILLVVDKKNTLTDLVLAQMGYYPQKDFINIAKKAVKSNEAYKLFINGDITKTQYDTLIAVYNEDFKYDTTFSYEDLINHEFYYFPHDDIYKYNPDFVTHKNVTVSMNGTFSGCDLILGLTYDTGSDALTGTAILLDPFKNILLNQSLILYRVVNDEEEDVVDDENKSVADGEWAIQYNDLSARLVIDSSSTAMPGQFTATGSFECSLLPDTVVTLTGGKISEIEPETPDMYYQAVVDDPSHLENPELFGGLKMKVAGVVKAKETTNFGTLKRGVYYTKAFGERYMDDAQDSDIVATMKEHIEEKHFNTSPFNAYVRFKYDDYTGDTGKTSFVPKTRLGYASCLNGTQMNALTNVFASFMMNGKNQLDKDKEHLRSVAGLKVQEFSGYIEKGSQALDGVVRTGDYPDVVEPTDGFDGLYEFTIGTDKYELWLDGHGHAIIDQTKYKSYEVATGTLFPTIKIDCGTEIYDITKIGEDMFDGVVHYMMENTTYLVDTEARLPVSISIYPKDFEKKDKVVDYLKVWNTNVDLVINGTVVPKIDRKDITITDNISMIIKAISTLISAVSIALIAFTSLSLVVSCFMIAVITFISVMERIKEIGVIRSLGGRKKDVSRLFIAENVVTGLSSGIFGIAVTYILQLIINAVVKPMGVPKLCALPWYYALLMVGIALLLSVISGLIPSLKASKKDPVVALRSE